MASLKVEFDKTLGDASKVEFLRYLWNINISEQESVTPFPAGHFATRLVRCQLTPLPLPTFSVKEYDSYFQWLRSQIKRFLDERDIEDPETARLIVHTYGGLLFLVAFIKENTDVKRRDIIERFRQYAPFNDQRNKDHIQLDVRELNIGAHSKGASHFIKMCT